MNISLSKEGKKMGFKEFVKTFGKHFKSLPDSLRQAKMEKVYTQLTGKKVTKQSGKSKTANSKSEEA